MGGSTMLDDEMLVRRASADDIDVMLEIKGALRRSPVNVGDPGGGFLLGSSADCYQLQVACETAWVLEVDREVIGFATGFTDAVLRASDLWREQEKIVWVDGFSPTAIVQEPVAYFDQLAVLPGAGRRFFGAALALRLLTALLDDHRHVLTTTVSAPFANVAAHAFIRRVGGEVVGTLDEVYPEVGPITSLVHYFSAEACAAGIDAHRRRHWLAPILALGLSQQQEESSSASMG